MRRWIGILWFACAALATARGAGSEAPVSFFAAITGGDIAAVTKHLDAGVSPDAWNAAGTNALYLACDKEQPAIAQLLVTRGADVNLTPPHGSTALQISIYRGFDAYLLNPKPGYPELIQTLISKGADVNAVDVKGNTPLIAAAEKDDVTTMRLLLKQGAKLGHKNADGWTALERAAIYRRRTIARELVLAGAPLDAHQQHHMNRYLFARKAGGWFPFILVGSFLLAALMHRRFKALPKREAAPGAGDDLPKLQHLKCGACGGSASLRPGVATCSHCHEPVPVPEDYTETLRLREHTIKLTEKAARLWQRVHLVSAAPVRWALWIAAVVFVGVMWQGLFPHFVRDALYDLMTFSGTMAWALSVLTMAAIAIALGGYAIYLGEVRSTLPALPAAATKTGTAENVACPNCAGVVEIKAGDIVAVCGYCGSESYRVALARDARAAATQQRAAARQSLYQAMTRVYELRENAALAVPAAMVVIGFILVLVLWLALLIL